MSVTLEPSIVTAFTRGGFMRSKIAMGVVVLLALALAFFLVITVTGDDGSMFNWYDECGYTCYQWADGSGDCYPCVCDDCKECPVPTKEPTKEPTNEPTPVPPTPTPEPTLPPPPEKPKCNRGLGNGSEGCDPGNSGGKPGAAGEDNE